MNIQGLLKNRDLRLVLPPVIAAAVLRFWALKFGLPSFLRPDEDMVVLPALGMIGGDLDPHDYTYPTLYKYGLALLFRLSMALGLGAPQAETAWQYAAYGFFVDASFFIGVARVVSATMGVLTVVAVYWIGKEGYGRFVGGAGAWFCTVSVLYVRDSHFGVTDIPSVCLLMFGMVYALQIAGRGLLRDYVLGGVFLGLATGTKYGSALGVIPLFVAHLCRKPAGVSVVSGWILNRRLWAGLGLAGVMFFAVSPFVFLNPEGFKLYFGFQILHLF